MFEKDAEKHADGIYHYKINVSDYGEDGIINYRYSDVKEAFQKGAEFGYNKANKWHYVKDKDYPKDNKPVLCILGDIDSENCEVGYYNDVGSGEPWHFETYHLPDDDGDNAWGVYAWKEIALTIKKRV
jgi:hypothetical protein